VEGNLAAGTDVASLGHDRTAQVASYRCAIGVLIFIGSYYFDTATNRGVALKLRFSDSVQGVAVYCCRIHGYISEKK
jgi:hypothetical protein